MSTNALITFAVFAVPGTIVFWPLGWACSRRFGPMRHLAAIPLAVLVYVGSLLISAFVYAAVFPEYFGSPGRYAGIQARDAGIGISAAWIPTILFYWAARKGPRERPAE